MRAYLAVLALIFLPVSALADGGFGFSTDTPSGQPPVGWHVEKAPADAVVSVAITPNGYRGHAAASITVAPRSDGTKPGASLRLILDAAPYRGKIVRLRAALRTNSTNGAAGWMWIRAEGPGVLRRERIDTPVQKNPTAWRRFTAFDAIPTNIQNIVIALAQDGPGASSIADVQFDVVDAATAGYEAPAALSPRGLANLTAFAKLFGYVRFFHPSDQAANADWNTLAVTGVDRVESAHDTRALIAALQDVFGPLAPTLRIFATGSAPPPSPALRAIPDATITGWRHQGVDLGNGYPANKSLYKSERVTMTAAPLDRMFAADLGGGVSILMPTTLYRDDKGTLPRAAASVFHGTKPEGFTPSSVDRATRLADVVLAWNVFQHFYPNFEYAPDDWSAVLPAALTEAATDDGERAFVTTLRKMTVALHDGHAQVFAQNMPEPNLPVFWDWVEGKLVVTRAPAESGLHPGDIVETIDGERVDAIVARLAPTLSAATPQWKMQRAQWYLKHQHVGETATFGVVGADGKTRSETLAYSDASWQDISAPQHPAIREVKPGLWVVDFALLQKADMDSAMDALAKARGIVFDMRGYPTVTAMDLLPHLSDKPIGTPQWHVPVATMPDQSDVTSENSGWYIPPMAPRFRGKLVLTIGGGAVSFAEEVAGIFRDNKLATIVGSTTAGTDGNINPFNLPGGYTLHYTGMRVLNLDGSRFIGIGIPPEVVVEPSIAGIRAGRDEVLEKALSIANSK